MKAHIPEPELAFMLAVAASAVVGWFVLWLWILF